LSLSSENTLISGIWARVIAGHDNAMKNFNVTTIRQRLESSARVAAVPICLLYAAGCFDRSHEVDSRGPAPIRVPADYPTIQAGIDAADRDDVVLVAGGVYTGPGNRDLQISRKPVTLKSERGPRFTIIDSEGTGADPHFGVEFQAGSDQSVLEGFTITGGYSNHGGAIRCVSTSPTIKNCVLADNYASVSGGAVRCKGASPQFANCTFVRSSAPVGGGFFLIAGSSPLLKNCIIAYSEQGGAIYSSDGASQPTVNCSDLFGNGGGDWDGRIADQAGINGNQSVDPQFCSMMSGDYRVRPESPCAVADSICSEPKGIAEIGCD
jgi:hypothetical protein